MSTKNTAAPELKLGLIPNDPSRPRLKFTDYVKTYPAYPASTDVGTGLHYPMWLNDNLSDCVAATRAALDLVDSAKLCGAPYTETDAEVLAFYRTQNPGKQDNGMVIQEGLEYLLKHPLPSGAQVVGFAEIDHKDQAQIDAAIAIGGRIWMGSIITQANRDQWAAGKPFDYVPDSEELGGHSWLAVGQNPTPGIRLVTWAAERAATNAYLRTLVTEAWFVITDSMLHDKRFIDGMDLESFAADFEAITGNAFPAIPTPPAPPAPPVSTVTFTNVRADVKTAILLTDIRLIAPDGTLVPPVTFQTIDAGTLGGKHPGPAHTVQVGSQELYLLDRNAVLK